MSHTAALHPRLAFSRSLDHNKGDFDTPEVQRLAQKAGVDIEVSEGDAVLVTVPAAARGTSAYFYLDEPSGHVSPTRTPPTLIRTEGAEYVSFSFQAAFLANDDATLEFELLGSQGDLGGTYDFYNLTVSAIRFHASSD